MHLFVDAGSRPLVVVRFNPDEYIDTTGAVVTSCWGYTPDRGLSRVKARKQKEWRNRLHTLKEHIHYISENASSKEVDVVHLFYDGWKST